MRTLYKVILSNEEATYVLADDLNAAALTAEQAYAATVGNRYTKAQSIAVIATEACDSFANKLLVAVERFPESTYDGTANEKGIYR